MKLGFKLVGVLFFLFIFIFGLLLFLESKTHEDLLHDTFIEKASIISRSYNSEFSSFEDIENSKTISSFTNKHLWLYPDILNIKVVSNLEEIIQTELNIMRKKSFEEVFQSQEETFHIQKNKLLFYSPIKISGQFGGVTEIEFTLERIDKLFVKERKELLIMFSIMIFVSLFLFYIVLSFIITNPIKKISEEVKEFSFTDTNHFIQIKSDGEIGSLTKSFNELFEEIHNKTNELKLKDKELEKIVGQRTKELKKKIDELEKFQRITIGRELKMIELKKQLNELQKKVKK